MDQSQGLILRVFFGLVLLIPAVCLCSSVYMLPALDVMNKSQQDYDIFRGDDSDRVGMDNYERLADDPTFDSAVGFTARLMGGRILIVMVIPLMVGVLIGLQGGLGRALNRIPLTCVGVMLSPVAVSILMVLFVGQTWNFDTFEPSPLGEIPRWLFLGDRDGARNVVNLADAMLALSGSLVVGSLAYAAVMRGKQAGYKPSLGLVGVWLIGLFWTIASVSQTLVLPYVMTQGGPGRSSTTLALYIFDAGFRRFQFGYGAAATTPLIFLTLLMGGLIWLVLTFTHLRLAFVKPLPIATANNLFSVVSLPLVLLFGLPLVGLTLWGVWLVLSNGGFEGASDRLALDTTFSNSFLTPFLTIWFLQIPFSYLAGFALGYLRPLGRWGSQFLFLPFLLFTLLPPDLLMLNWYEQAREQELLDGTTVLAFPWLLGAFSLILFKLFFDGALERYQAAREEGKNVSDAFIWQVFVPSGGIVLVVGTVLSFLSLQSFTWSLISTSSPEYYTMPIQLLRVRGEFGTQFGEFASATMLFSLITSVPFLVIFLPLHLLVVDRLALVAGETTMPEAVPADSPELFEAPAEVSVEPNAGAG